MSQPSGRRQFIRAGIAAAASLSLPARALAQSRSAALETIPLSGRLGMIAGAGANVTLLAGAGGEALLVDGGLPEHAPAVLDAVARRSGSPRVDVLFNTNWRPEHTGVNDTLGPAGTKIIAHENTKLWMGADFVVEWEKRDHAPRSPEALPNSTFYTSGSLVLGGERVEHGYLMQAHTDGDIYVFFPDSNVLVVSDLLAVNGYPIVDYVTGGWIGGMERATAALLELADRETQIVPGVGPVQTRADLEAQLELCTAAREAVRDAYRMGRSVDEFIAAKPLERFEPQRGDSELFLYLVYKGAWGHVRELGGGII